MRSSVAHRHIFHPTRGEPGFALGSTTLTGLGSWIPKSKVSNEAFGQSIEWIDWRSFMRSSGVQTHHEIDTKTSLIDMAERAVIDLFSHGLSASNAKLEDVDTILWASVSRALVEPATAILLQKRLGIRKSVSFDISDACLSFADGLIVADAFVNTGLSRNVLVVSAEHISRIAYDSLMAIEKREYGRECLAALTLGDGAAAALVTHQSKHEPGLVVRAFQRATLSEYVDACTLEAFGQPMFTDAKRMFEGALTHSLPMANNLLHKIGWRLEDLDLIVPHQASLKVIKQASQLMGLPLDVFAVTLDQFGNMASVSVPFTLQKAVSERKLSNGAKVLIGGFGSGLSFAMIAVQLKN